MYKNNYNNESDDEYTYEDEEEYDECNSINNLDITPNIDTFSLSQSYNDDNINKYFIFLLNKFFSFFRFLKVPQKFIDNETKNIEDLVWITDQKLAFRLCTVIQRSTDSIYVQYLNDSGSYERVYFYLILLFLFKLF